MTEAYPLQWPSHRPRRAPRERKNGNFGKQVERSNGAGNTWKSKGDISIADARKRLQEELERIGARHIVLSTNVELRLDGFPRSGREPDDPGVALYFQLAGKPHCLPCDTYTTVAHNIAAIAAHIQATRAIERHGVASVYEMFTGFVALPQPKRWWEILDLSENASADVINARHRVLAREHHPDRGGSPARMSEINAARDEGLRART